MKKTAITAIALFLMLGMVPSAQVDARPGGVGGLLVGCCFGVRTVGEYNEGKDLHFREWGRLIPILNIGLAIWDGIQGYEGITTSELAAEYGSNYF